MPAAIPNPPGPLSSSEPWELVAEGYAVETVQLMLPFARDAIALARPSARARVLDVATGPGVLALEVASRVERVDALDFSPSMLAQLESQRAQLELENVFAVLGDGQALPFDAGSFDAAFSMFGLMFFPDRARGFAEIRRVLRSGGVTVVSSWAPVDQSPLMLIVFDTLRAMDASRAAPHTDPLSLENPVLFERELIEAGFDDVTVTAHEHGIWVESSEGLWNSIVRGSAPLLMLRSRLGPEEWARQSARAEAYLAERITAPRELNTTAYLGFGRRR
jgi:SAM-dependent methyltransferase